MLGSSWFAGNEIPAQLDERCYRSLRLLRYLHLQTELLEAVQQG